MTRGKGKRPKEILSRAEEQVLKDDKKELEVTLKQTQEYGVGTAASQIDQTVIKKQIGRIDKAIQDRQVPKVRGTEKDRLAKEAAQIEVDLQVGMPTRDEMRYPVKNPGAVRKHMNWDKRNNVKIERYRYIQRVINPDEPRSVENLRREK